MEKNKKILNERSSDEIYHFTSLPNLFHMVKDNRITSSLVYSSEVETQDNLYKGYNFYISTTSTKSYNFGYQSMVGLAVRLKLNGRLINSDFKISRVAFNTHSDRMSDTSKNKFSDEMEERIYLNKPSIPFSRYVDEITLMIDPSDLDKKYIKRLAQIKHLVNSWGIELKSENYSIEDYDGVSTMEKENETPNARLLGFVLGSCAIYTPEIIDAVVGKLVSMTSEEEMKKVYNSALRTEEFLVLTNIESYLDSMEHNLDHPIKEITKRKGKAIGEIIKGYFMEDIEHFDRTNDSEVFLIDVMSKIMGKFKIKNPSAFSEKLLNR